MFPERVGDRGQRHLQVLRHHVPVGDVVGDPSQPVHVVGEGDQLGGNVGNNLEGLAHHGGPRDLAEGADMGQPRWPVAGFQQHLALGRRLAAQPFQDLARLGEGPGVGLHGDATHLAHLCDPANVAKLGTAKPRGRTVSNAGAFVNGRGRRLFGEARFRQSFAVVRRIRVMLVVQGFQVAPDRKRRFPVQHLLDMGLGGRAVSRVSAARRH